MGGSNQALEPGNVSVAAPYYISGLTGTLAAVAAGGAVFTLRNIGRINAAGVLTNVPLYVSQIRLKYAPLTAGVAGFAVSKATVTALRDTAGAAGAAATQRKTTGYPAIPLSEVATYVSTTAAITGGTVALQGGPLDMTDATLGAVWRPSDLCPLILENDEGIEVRSTITMAATGTLLVAVDFLRQ